MGAIRLYGSTSGYLELQAPAVAPDAVLTLPSDSVQPGLVHLHTETFSAVSSVSIDNVFSSTYENYVLEYIIDHDTISNNGRLKLRSGGVDDSTSNYSYEYLNVTGTTVSASRNTGLSDGFRALEISNIGPSIGKIYVARPGTATATALGHQAFGGESGGLIRIHAGTHDVASPFDGFTLSTTSGTMSGTLRVYGYRNS